MSVHLAMLRAAALLAPREQRTEWFAEWSSELWYVRHTCRHGNEAATAFCLGGFKDALWLRRNSPSPNARKLFHFEPPLHCGLFLAVWAVVSLFFAFRLPLHLNGQFIRAHLLMLILAFLILPAVTSLSIGEYPLMTRLRRWMFLAIKIALIIPIVFCGSLDLAAITSTAIQPHGLLVGYVLAFRWALIDQRQRCPVCLRLLSNPARIGWPSQTFLEWYGTELMCLKGHGLLHVTEIPSCYDTQRWLSLDPSWSRLFS